MCNEQQQILSARKEIQEQQKLEEIARRERLGKQEKIREEQEEKQRQHNLTIKNAIKRAEKQLYEKSMKTLKKGHEIQEKVKDQKKEILFLNVMIRN